MDKDKQKTSLETWNSEELGEMNQNAANAAPEVATTSQEALEEGFQAKTVYEGGLNAEDSETAAQGPREGVSEGEGDASEPENDFLKESEQRRAEMPGKEERKTKRSLMVLVLLLVLTVAAVAVWWFWGHREEEQRQDGSTGQVETGPSEEQKPEAQPVELSVDDELVQRLFDEFSPVTSPWDNQTAFYTKAISGNLDRQAVMDIAFSNVRATNGSMPAECKGSYSFDTDTSEPWMAEYCYSGEELRQEISKLFGLYYTFTENDTLSQVCPYNYNAINDEFYQTTICGGMFPAGVIRELYKAEKDENRIYLYELATYWSQARDDCSEVCRLSDGGWDAEIEGLTVEELNKAGKLSEYPEANEVFDKFKWTFVWNGENYVFEKLEKIQN